MSAATPVKYASPQAGGADRFDMGWTPRDTRGGGLGKAGAQRPDAEMCAMGIWGYRLFEDDCALDLRAGFRDLIGDGLSPEAATSRLVADWGPDRKDPNGYAVFWLAMGAVQWDLGRLTPLVLCRALGVIDQEIGLEGWRDGAPNLLASRRRVYRQLRKMLLRPQPPPRRVPKRYRTTTTWKRGYLVSYRCLSGRIIYLRILGIHSDKGEDSPIADICDWQGEGPPPLSRAGSMGRWCAFGPPTSEHVTNNPAHSTFALHVDKPKEFPDDRVAVVAKGLRVKEASGIGSMFFGGWVRLDKFLEEAFGIT